MNTLVVVGYEIRRQKIPIMTNEYHAKIYFLAVTVNIILQIICGIVNQLLRQFLIIHSQSFWFT